MKELSKTGSGSLLQTLHADLQTPAPYSSDVLLLQTYVAGTTHTAGLEELEPFLKLGDRLDLVRIPDNPSDPNAIKIYTRVKTGVTPEINALAALMFLFTIIMVVIADTIARKGEKRR